VTTTARMGSYAPRIAGDDALPRWLVVTSHDFDRIATQVVEAPPVALPDAGVPPPDGGRADGGAGVDDGAVIDRDGGPVRPPGGASSDCDCHVAGQPRSVAGSVAVIFAAVARRRRRRA
jgi:MYXO-CTERM domain-containing protein